MSFTGYTGYKVASQRPNANIFVFTSNRRILTQLNLVWGVKGFYYDKTESTDQTISDIKKMLRDEGKIKKGELVINIASMPIEEHGNSNMLKLSYVE
jgi:pyruvate kinase